MDMSSRLKANLANTCFCCNKFGVRGDAAGAGRDFGENAISFLASFCSERKSPCQSVVTPLGKKIDKRWRKERAVTHQAEVPGGIVSDPLSDHPQMQQEARLACELSVMTAHER